MMYHGNNSADSAHFGPLEVPRSTRCARVPGTGFRYLTNLITGHLDIQTDWVSDANLRRPSSGATRQIRVEGNAI